MDVDAKIGQLGKFGRWQLAVFFFSACIAQCFACWHMLIIVFIGADPQHHCKLGQNATLNESIPLEVRKGELQLSQCLMYDNASFSNHTTKCTDGWDYSFKYVKDSIISEWDLVCDDNYLAEISQAVFMVGVVIGAGAFAPLADTFGRKFAFILAEWCLVVSGVVVAFAPNYYVFVVARFFGGIFQQGLSIPAFIIACELFPASARTYAGVGFNLFWAFAMIVLAGVAYFIRSWSWLQLAISIPGVLTLFHYWKTPESIPWLIAQNRYKHANDVIQRAAKFNKVSVPENMFKEEMLEDEMDGGEEKQCQMIIRSCNADKQGKRKKTVSAMDVFKSPRMAGNAAIMCLIWFVNSIVYYGLTLSTGNLSDGSVYINFVLSGLVEIPANLVAMFALQRWGRRWPVAIFHFTAGVGLLLTLAVPEKTGSGLNLAPLRLTLSLIGKMGISGSFAAVWMWAPELYPTNIRNFGVGMSSVCGRIGSILAPFSVYVVKYIPWLPTSIFGGLALLVAVLGLFLPETLNRALPQTVQDVENWTRVISPEEKERNKHLSLVIPQRIRLDTYSLATSLQSIRD